MAKYVKVELPKNQPKETLELCDFIIEKDTADGVNSLSTKTKKPSVE